MRQAQFDIVIHGVPTYHAVFRVQKVPGTIHWARLSVGDLMYWNHHRNIMVKVSNSMGMTVTADYLTFVGYMTAAGMRKTGGD